MAVDQTVLDYYSNLLIAQYYSLPRATATIESIVSPVLMDSLPTEVQSAYELGTAVGPQLDVLGKYVGISRTGSDLSGNNIVLNDIDFTQLIKLVIIKNNSGSSLADIENLLAVNFPGQILITDTADMSLIYTIYETIGSSNLLALLATGKYFPRPMGVGFSIIILPTFASPLFGFRTYSTPLGSGFAPFNSYQFYRTQYHWLSYGDL